MIKLSVILITIAKWPPKILSLKKANSNTIYRINLLKYDPLNSGSLDLVYLVL